MQRPPWACLKCAHLVRDDVDGVERTCKAFPIEIPLEIWSGDNDHTQPFTGDGGVQFEPLVLERQEDLTAAMVFHLPGGHDQSTHGHGHIMQFDTALAFYQDADLTPDQKTAVHHYTTDGYAEINMGLRGEAPIGDKDQVMIDDISSAMHPLPQETTLFRHMAMEDFGAEDRATRHEKLQSMVGHTISHDGFTSASIDESGIRHLERNVQIKIYAPAGTPAVYAAPISQHGDEAEMILDKGMKFKVLAVEPNGDCCAIMHWEVVL